MEIRGGEGKGGGEGEGEGSTVPAFELNMKFKHGISENGDGRQRNRICKQQPTRNLSVTTAAQIRCTSTFSPILIIFLCSVASFSTLCVCVCVCVCFSWNYRIELKFERRFRAISDVGNSQEETKASAFIPRQIG